jgi:ABC-type lipoprotein release transport system permease subunit
MVLLHGARLIVSGVEIGLVVACAASGHLAPLLVGVGPRDPTVLGSVVLTLFVTAGLASVIPAWRAARVDPASILRE